MSEELKPCPFCGEKSAILIDDNIHGRLSLNWSHWHVACQECLCQTNGETTAKRAIEAWNKRIKDESNISKDTVQT